ncbi:protein GLUTAMINE DUMPER 5-like [Bidens hawaiensis]|uniref:protein GLUTAMINE DUMPER 5-like n=1 Tax=Bidens hawaiensis TaxID=980011 RepID=UPI00404987FB
MSMHMQSASSISSQRSPWHSPVPYLFGGLAAMLGLIAFALLFLACSYWKLSAHLDNRPEGERDIESNNKSDINNVKVFEEKYLVIMAGQVNPTFLATPMLERLPLVVVVGAIQQSYHRR